MRRRHSFAVPESVSGIGIQDDLSPNDVACRRIDVEWDSARPPSSTVAECARSYMKLHGERPAGLLVGWELVLMLHAELGYSDSFMGIPIFAYPWQFRLGCAPLMAGNAFSMLSRLSEQQFPFEGKKP